MNIQINLILSEFDFIEQFQAVPTPIPEVTINSHRLHHLYSYEVKVPMYGTALGTAT